MSSALKHANVSHQVDFFFLRRHDVVAPAPGLWTSVRICVCHVCVSNVCGFPFYSVLDLMCVSLSECAKSP